MSVRVRRVAGTPVVPRLNGRNWVLRPASLVVMATRSGSTAKWTSARRLRVTFLGSRSVRYWVMACSMF